MKKQNQWSQVLQEQDWGKKFNLLINMSEQKKPRVPRGDKMIEDCYVMLQKITKMNYGEECEPHDEECCVCAAYLLLREYKRLHFYETN